MESRYQQPIADANCNIFWLKHLGDRNAYIIALLVSKIEYLNPQQH